MCGGETGGSGCCQKPEAECCPHLGGAPVPYNNVKLKCLIISYNNEKMSQNFKKENISTSRALLQILFQLFRVNISSS